MVRVTVVDGRISTVELLPKVMRLPSQELAEAFATAANAALADLASKYPAVAAPTVDVAALDAQLAQAQDEGARQLRRFTQSIDDALSRIGR
jgi:hypothetical protein